MIVRDLRSNNSHQIIVYKLTKGDVLPRNLLKAARQVRSRWIPSVPPPTIGSPFKWRTTPTSFPGPFPLPPKGPGNEVGTTHITAADSRENPFTCNPHSQLPAEYASSAVWDKALVFTVSALPHRFGERSIICYAERRPEGIEVCDVNTVELPRIRDIAARGSAGQLERGIEGDVTRVDQVPLQEFHDHGNLICWKAAELTWMQNATSHGCPFTLSLPGSKSTFSQPFYRETYRCCSENLVVQTFIWVSCEKQVLHTVWLIWLARLWAGKFEIDHS